MTRWRPGERLGQENPVRTLEAVDKWGCALRVRGHRLACAARRPQGFELEGRDLSAVDQAMTGSKALATLSPERTARGSLPNQQAVDDAVPRGPKHRP